MRLTPEQKAKKKYKKLKLEARRIGNVYGWNDDEYDWGDGKKEATGELELFKKIAKEREVKIDGFLTNFVRAKDIDKKGIEQTKMICIDDLTHWNFDHTTPKSRGKDYKLDPENIQIVSIAWHFWKTNGQILQIEYPN